jgi:hypothetical protein
MVQHPRRQSYLYRICSPLRGTALGIKTSSMKKNALSFIPRVSCVQPHPYQVTLSVGQKYDVPLWFKCVNIVTYFTVHIEKYFSSHSKTNKNKKNIYYQHWRVSCICFTPDNLSTWVFNCVLARITGVLRLQIISRDHCMPVVCFLDKKKGMFTEIRTCKTANKSLRKFSEICNIFTRQ